MTQHFLEAALIRILCRGVCPLVLFARGTLGYKDHASVRLPGVLHTNVGHSKFGYRTF